MKQINPLTLFSYPRAILHIDGDAFFASCEQSRNPAYQGKPLITGKERGIAASLSYEAKALGVTRGMRIFEIKKICPSIICLPSDYETYSLLSKRFYSIVRRYTSDVEEYGIDECFADLTGLRRPFRMSYPQIAKKIKEELDRELGFTFSVGLGPNKSIAKIGSKWKKPSGFTSIPGNKIHEYIKDLPVEDVWGIGPQTSALLNKFRIYTAFGFAQKTEQWVKKYLTKPHIQIWQELNGKPILELETKEKETYASIQKTKTFTPASRDRNFVLSQLSKNIENAAMKARRYNLEAKEAIVFLKTQQFKYSAMKLKFSRPTSFSHEIIGAVTPLFDTIFLPEFEYRATGITLTKLETIDNKQMDLFREHLTVTKFSHLYAGVDKLRKKYGKHTVFLGTSFSANKFSAHLGDRGDTSDRNKKLLKGETKRRKLGIPMFLGEVY